MRVAFLCLCFLGFTVFGREIVFHGNGQPKAILKAGILRSWDANTPSPVQIHFEIPGIEVNAARDGFDSIKIQGLNPLGITGSPEVGVTGSLITVPPGYEARLVVDKLEQKAVAGVVAEPAQEKFRCDCPSARAFAFNSALYESKQLFPSKAVTLETVGKLQNLKLIRVALQPVQQDLGARQLVVTTVLDARVEFYPTGERTQTGKNAAFVNTLASRFTVNGASLRSSLSREATAKETFVIFTADDYKPLLKPLIDWKKARGMSVEVFTLTEAGGTKETVKAFLQKYYDEHTDKPSYVLFVGNKVTMPAFEEKTSKGTQIAITDYPYSLLSGEDALPDLLYGRLLADDAHEVETQVARWVQYEKNPEVDAWYAKGTTIASNEGQTPSDKDYAIQIQDTLKKYTYKEMDSFFQGDISAKEQGVLDALLQGRSWISYFGHGTGTAWGSFNDHFDLTSVEKLQNTRLPFIFDVACQNANFRTIPKPFGKAWVTHEVNGTPSGAVAYLGGSVNISWDPPAIMSIGIAKSHFEKPVFSIGGTVLAGQLHLIKEKGTDDSTIDNLRWYNLLGDPSLLMRTSEPKTINVHRVPGTGLDVLEFKTDANGAAIPGLSVTLTNQSGDVVTTTRTREDGIASLPVDASLQNSNPTVTISGYNVKPFQVQLNEVQISR